MTRLVHSATTALLLAGPALADVTLHAVNKIYRAHYAYNPGTGRIERARDPGTLRFGPGVLWCTTETSGYFSSTTGEEGWLNWGDVHGPVNGFEFSYYLDGGAPVEMQMWFYKDADGFNDQDHSVLAGFKIVDLPGSPDPNGPCCSGWVITVDLAGGSEFTLPANDEDGDGLGDFAYIYHFNVRSDGPEDLLGPQITDPWCAGEPGDANDPGTWSATGSENAFDVYDPFDPNHPTENNVGTFWFGGQPFVNFRMLLYTGGSNCAAAGCELGDFDSDCDVDLEDLSVLLADFGTLYGFDELSELLGQFGNTCG